MSVRNLSIIPSFVRVPAEVRDSDASVSGVDGDKQINSQTLAAKLVNEIHRREERGVDDPLADPVRVTVGLPFSPAVDPAIPALATRMETMGYLIIPGGIEKKSIGLGPFGEIGVEIYEFRVFDKQHPNW
jgi:hypothetical protein